MGNCNNILLLAPGSPIVSWKYALHFHYFPQLLSWCRRQREFKGLSHWDLEVLICRVYGKEDPLFFSLFWCMYFHSLTFLKMTFQKQWLWRMGNNMDNSNFMSCSVSKLTSWSSLKRLFLWQVQPPQEVHGCHNSLQSIAQKDLHCILAPPLCVNDILGA